MDRGWLDASRTCRPLKPAAELASTTPKEQTMAKLKIKPRVVRVRPVRGAPKRAHLPAAAKPINWHGVAGVACLSVDWATLAHSATGSKELGGLVGAALHVLGKSFLAEAMRVNAEAARKAAKAARTVNEARTKAVQETTEAIRQPFEQARKANGSTANASDARVDTDSAGQRAEAPPIEPQDTEPPTAYGKEANQTDQQANATTAHASAAALLRVELDASEDEIRKALRAQLASSRLHPDHGGNGDQAKTLISAKNLLLERARAARP